jgi:hypothetical protein
MHLALEASTGRRSPLLGRRPFAVLKSSLAAFLESLVVIFSVTLFDTSGWFLFFWTKILVYKCQQILQ